MVTRNLRKKSTIGNRSPRSARVFKHSPDVILTVDHKRRVQFMSRAMNGFKPAEMIGCDSVRLFPARIRPWYRQALARAFGNRENGQAQFPTEASVWWEIRLVPIQREGVVTEAMLIVTEVTEARIRQAQAIRHARLATIGVLAASIAHEINNPNNAILFNASLMERGWQDALPILEEYHQANGEFSLGGLPYGEARTILSGLLNEITLNTIRVRSIVDNLKHMARRDREETALAPVNVHDAIQAALMILNHKIRKHTDHCVYLPQKMALTVLGNVRQLEQVFINVILNALQALTDRQQSVRIRTSLETIGQEATVLITIEDEGCGIDTAHLPLVTEPFFTTKSEMEGTGLGLSISNLIVRGHRGSIRFDSVPGAGTTVTIRFPYRSHEES
ncbi:MAG: PAS domain-containing protein [Magnetococcales bacterium]|nr:PAS domain-containing protein [Magnetococcales bacterium]